MARKPLVPTGPPKRGRAKAVGKGAPLPPPPGKNRKPKGARLAPPLPPPPLRPRVLGGMGPPVLFVVLAPGPRAAGRAPAPLGLAVAAGVGASRILRGIARGIRGGAIPF